MGHQHRVFVEAVRLGLGQVPVARERPVFGQGPKVYTLAILYTGGGLETYLHWEKKAMRMATETMAVSAMPTSS
jgi:hypothetical protein